ncbi:hypothetical protein OLO84_01120 [Campylobacter jejuni]|nr:hypothetical protein [Campylobacter jejuni]ECP9272991.1 hypothetical protein [Campylobacter jejuni]MCW1316611.1 hypothetical protein [Campylobacter jejuni]MCW1319981.1 hypothetical protein [Campylobacter jejuni]HEC2817108.1 hypothetical protein [Campylobacter jejuni]
MISRFIYSLLTAKIALFFESRKTHTIIVIPKKPNEHFNYIHIDDFIFIISFALLKICSYSVLKFKAMEV